MTAAPLMLANARLVLADETLHGSLRVEDGRIADIAAGAGVPSGAEDMEGDLIVPGLVEIHTDNLEKHLNPRANVFWPSFQALLSHDAQVASAGITTVFDAVALGDRDGREERLRYLDEAVTAIQSGRESGHLRAEHFLHLRCEVPKPQVTELFERYADDPSVRLVSLMDHTPGDRQFRDLEVHRDFCVNHFGENPDDYERRVVVEREQQALYADKNRQAIAEGARVRGLALASHDDATPDHVAQAKSEGAAISEFPTTIIAAEAAHAAGLTTVMGAPNVIRGGSHSGNIAARDLAAQDLLHSLSSDYMPISLVAAPFRLSADLGWPIHRAMALVTRNPAEAAGLTDRGEIAPDKRGDLVRLYETPDGPVVRAVWRAGRRIA